MIKRYSFYIFFAFFFLQGIALQSQLQVQYDANSEPMAGQPYDIDVRASDFNGLFSVQFAVAWDSLVLEVDSLFNVSTSLLDFSRSSLTLPSETMTGTKGRVNLSWFTSAGQSLPDDHLLFTMRFNQVGSECDETEIILTNPENLSISSLMDKVELEVDTGGNSMVCESCGTTHQEFKKGGRLGCEACYHVFRPVLDPLLDGMHAGTKHLGKVPAGSVSRIKFEQSVESLRGELSEAVEKEDFEKAAKLRDQLRDLESKTKAKA